MAGNMLECWVGIGTVAKSLYVEMTTTRQRESTGIA